MPFVVPADGSFHATSATARATITNSILHDDAADQDAANAEKTVTARVVDAGIAITPTNDTNPAGTDHIFTITVTAVPGAVGPPIFNSNRPDRDSGTDVAAVGTGTCNKHPATIYFILIDAGEPGTADTAEYHIVSSGCTLDGGPAQLLKGNHQFHKN